MTPPRHSSHLANGTPCARKEIRCARDGTIRALLEQMPLSSQLKQFVKPRPRDDSAAKTNGQL